MPTDRAVATDGRKLNAANPSPCSSCPWRTANHGQPHPDGWYTVKNRDRLWSKLRRGETMSCHKTDPDNPVPEDAKKVPEGTPTHECAGGLVLQQRELMKAQGYPAPSLPKYQREHKRGLTKVGVMVLCNRAMFAGVPLIGELKMSAVNLNEEVSHPPLGPWEPAKVARAVAKEMKR